MELNEYRGKMKQAHICRDCKKQDAYTLAGHTYCFECSEKQRLAKQKARADPAKKEKMLLQKREQIDRYRSENKCLRCGKKLHNEKRLCEICYEIQRRELRKSRGSIPRLYGIICWQCNKQPCMDGRKLCPDCYEKAVKVVCENRKKVDMKNHPWRK